MALGLFDIVGPVMHGPSSNHTGGANRIGYLAREIMGGTPDAIHLGFHRGYMNSYAGQHSHSAMIAGLLGYREYDDESVNALEEAEERELPWDTYAIADESISRNTFRTIGEIGDQVWEINGDSIGGGNIIIDRINTLPVHLDGNDWLLIIADQDKAAFDQAVSRAEELAGEDRTSSVSGQVLGKKWLYIGTYKSEPPAVQQEGTAIYRTVRPLFTFADSGAEPLFTTFAELEELCQTADLIDVIMEYEVRRSKVSKERVFAEAQFMVREIQKALKRGKEEPIQLIGGLTDPNDGKKLVRWVEAGNPVVNEMFASALANAVILAQLNAAGSKIVAAPTGGSAGTLPGTLIAAGSRYGKSDEELAKALLVAAAIGLVIGNKASFSGTVGGCQSEVGIGAAMGAGTVAWMGGGRIQQVIQAATIALKNVLGLSCDPPASPTEVPCIKRNAMGVAVAFMGAELGLAGLCSAVAPDDVVEALADTQRRLPQEIKYGGCGGLACTASGKALNCKWRERLKEISEENKH